MCECTGLGDRVVTSMPESDSPLADREDLLQPRQGA
jgi:hypothetical protein